MLKKNLYEFTSFAISIVPKGNAMCSKPHFTLWNILEEDGDWDEEGDWGDPDLVEVSIKDLGIVDKIINRLEEEISNVEYSNGN